MWVEALLFRFSALTEVSVKGEGQPNALSGSHPNLNVSTEDVRPGYRAGDGHMRERSNTAGSDGSHSFTPSKPNSVKTGSSLGNSVAN